MGKWILLSAALAHPGCAVAVYGESRKVTREKITPALAVVAPGVPQDGAADCVMKGLTEVEIVSLPNSKTMAEAGSAEAFVKGVIARPPVAQCLAAVPRA